MAGKVWGVVVVQDVLSDATTSAKYLFLQEKPGQPHTVPCYDITAVSNVKNHLEETFTEVTYKSLCMCVCYRTHHLLHTRLHSVNRC